MDENVSAYESLESFNFRTPSTFSWSYARLNSISLDEVRQIIREEIRAALKERD